MSDKIAVLMLEVMFGVQLYSVVSTTTFKQAPYNYTITEDEDWWGFYLPWLRIVAESETKTNGYMTVILTERNKSSHYRVISIKQIKKIWDKLRNKT